MPTRIEVVRTARSYIGTPFHHAARLPGVGMDCVGLVVCLLRDLLLVPRDWDVQGYGLMPDGSLVPECERLLQRITGMPRAGDMAVLGYELGPQHVGILGDYPGGGLSLIHATNRRSVRPARVVETRLLVTREQQFAAAYALPGITG